MRRCSWRAGFLLAPILSFTTSAHASITLGQVDSFQSADTLGWTDGGLGQIFPSVVSSGGPGGADDGYLQSVSTGGTGADSRQVVLNPHPAIYQGGSPSQWTGDYIAAGVTQITVQMKNFGPGALSMRVAVQDATGVFWYGSANATPLPADGNWHLISFDLTSSGLTAIGSPTEPLSQTLSSVGQLRILSASGGPSFRGDAVNATLGIDDITAAPEPGILLPLLAAGMLLRQRRMA